MLLRKEETKQIVVDIPDELLKEIDGLIASLQISRSDFIHEAMYEYVREKRKSILRTRMQQGYQEMARINLHIAKEAVLAEDEAELTVHRLVSGV